VKFIVMWFSPRSVFIPFRSIYSQHTLQQEADTESNIYVDMQFAYTGPTTNNLTIIIIIALSYHRFLFLWYFSSWTSGAYWPEPICLYTLISN
jgi:hypothetical protein